MIAKTGHDISTRGTERRNYTEDEAAGERYRRCKAEDDATRADRDEWSE
jgi:hypothetical protein